MALNEESLAGALEALFESMGNEPMSNHDYAAKLAKAVTDQIKTAAIPAGEVIVAVAGGSGAPATGTSNAGEIKVV